MTGTESLMKNEMDSIMHQVAVVDAVVVSNT
jgi:hypothetical protein